jgi:K+-transporting ATPase ATPase C chain
MKNHLRANFWLLVLTVLIAAVIYPVVVLGIGQVFFHEKAEGSLLTDSQGKRVGARLIAQPFTNAKYFHPRPSAVSYNAAATGGSNWSASNPALRKRVLRDLGPLLKYRDGKPVGPDIETWVRESLRTDPKILERWQQDSPDLSAWWVAADSANADFVAKWAAEHPGDIARWRATAAQGVEPTPADLAVLFFASFADGKSPAWPESSGQDLQSAFFQVWWQDHATADVEPVPADLVMTSGCGVDPDITVKGALYQLDRVVAAWAQEQKRGEAATRDTIRKLIERLSYAPLGGLVGQPMINVLELNLAVRDAMRSVDAVAP